MPARSGPLRHFTGSLVATAAGLALGFGVGLWYRGSVAGALATVFTVAVLAVLEVSLSFDNAVVNATVLKDMTPLWRHRFLTWGVAIAVFGMRLVFPLVVVSAVARIGPWETVRLAVAEPAEYARLLGSAHAVLAAFMLLDTVMDVPEAVTGLVGAGVIGLAVWSSVRWRRRHPAAG